MGVVIHVIKELNESAIITGFHVCAAMVVTDVLIHCPKPIRGLYLILPQQKMLLDFAVNVMRITSKRWNDRSCLLPNEPLISHDMLGEHNHWMNSPTHLNLVVKNKLFLRYQRVTR